MTTPQPGIGDWYRLNGGALFEVVALDDDDGTIEIQYFDGTVEEMDIEDWEAQWEEGALESAEAPEDWSGSVDVEGGDEERRGSDSLDDDRDVRASPLDGIDLFECGGAAKAHHKTLATVLRARVRRRSRRRPTAPHRTSPPAVPG